MDQDTDKRNLKQLMEGGKVYWPHSTANHKVARELFLLRESMRQRCKGAAERMNATSAAVRDHGHDAETGDTVSAGACPRCKGSAYRVPRRLVDRVMSRFVWVIRYRCRSMVCGWEGNLRVSRRPLLIQGPW